MKRTKRRFFIALGANSRGASLVEVTAALLIVAALLVMLVPVVAGYRSAAMEKMCRENRERIEEAYRDYCRTVAGGDMTFREYASIEVGDLDKLCPAGGTYTLITLDEGTPAATVKVHCSVHGDDFERVAVPEFSSAADALGFASQMYELGTLFMDRLLSANDGVSTYRYLPFDLVHVGGTGRTVGGYREFTLENGGKTTRLAASDEFRKLLDYGDNELSVGRIYFITDADGAYTTAIDFVVVKQGGIWAKYATDASASGTGDTDLSARPGGNG